MRPTDQGTSCFQGTGCHSNAGRLCTDRLVNPKVCLKPAKMAAAVKQGFGDIRSGTLTVASWDTIKLNPLHVVQVFIDRLMG